MNTDDVMEVARLKGRVIALEAQVQTLEAEAKVYEAMRRAFAKSDCEEVARLKAELTNLKSTADYLKAENKRLRSASFVTAVPSEEYERLKAEVDGLKAETDRLFFLLNKSCIEVERLRKAGDAMASCVMIEDYIECAKAWNAAKDGKPTE